MRALINFYCEKSDFKPKSDKVYLLKLFIAFKEYLSYMIHDRRAESVIATVFSDALSLKE